LRVVVACLVVRVLLFHGVVGRLSHALWFNYNLIKMLVLWEITKLDKASVGHLCESIGLMRFPPLMSPRTQVLVSCSETERANHMWRSYGPSLDHCRNLPPCPGATTSSGVYAFTFCTYAMICYVYFLFAWPEGVYISVLFRSGTFMRSGCVQSHFRASDLS
jgi:hypothetical protein